MHFSTLEPSKVAVAVTDHSLPAPLFPRHGKVSHPEKFDIVEIERSYCSSFSPPLLFHICLPVSFYAVRIGQTIKLTKNKVFHKPLQSTLPTQDVQLHTDMQGRRNQ